MSEKNEKEWDEKQRGEYRSLFWPIVLIGIGVIILLANLEVFDRENIAVLFRLWPLLLILIGADILFGRRAPAVGALIGLAAVALVIGLMLVGPSLGWGEDGEVKTSFYSASIGEATSARVNLNLSSAPTTVSPLSDSPNLIEANLTHRGEIKFDVRGDRDKSIDLSQEGGSSRFWFDWFDEQGDDLRWEIGLSPQVPLDVVVDGSSGRLTLDMSGLQLTNFDLDVGSGSVDANLPATDGHYMAKVDGGSGSCRLSIADSADAELEFDVGSGSVSLEIGDDADLDVRAQGGSGHLAIDVPGDAAVRLDVRDSGSGSVQVPSEWERTRRGDDDEGTWETPGFEDAAHRILIVVEDVGSGSIEVR